MYSGPLVRSPILRVSEQPPEPPTELLMSAQLSPSKSRDHHVPTSYLQHVLKWQESASRCYLAAIKTLAQVRRLQSGIPNSQTNVQINLSARGDQSGQGPHD